MCGIAGYASLDSKGALDTGAIEPMLACVAHRGPDDAGVHAADGVILGHRRLSIIDVQGGHQPLYGASSDTVLIANGEVYNYRELRKELEESGHHFRTDSDSEVAAHAYDEWGLDFLDRLDGMYALALWDGRTRRLVLVRDRMGEKPLFYTVADGQLIFASELGAILAHPAVPRDIDPDALSQYLALEYVPAPLSIIRSVRKLEPGCALVLERGRLRTIRYWQIEPQPAAHEDYGESVRELRTRLEQAVRSQLVSDVPLGVFLSGGLDSSTIAALAAREGALETFSIGFDEPSFDESGYARKVAAHIGSHHHERIVRAAEMPDLVPRLPRILDEPLGDASIIPTALLSAFARERVTVALGGDGGDELFAGYPMHQAERVARLGRVLPAPLHDGLRRLARWMPVRHGNFALGYKVNAFLRGSSAAPPLNHALWMSSFSPAEQGLLLTAVQTYGAQAFDPILAAWKDSEGATPLSRVTHLDAVTYLPNDILTKVDRASMAVALEVRAPFLARSVVEFAASLPDEYRMRRLTGKRILRDAARDLLPPWVFARPKKGFGMPVAAWLNGSLRTLTDDLLSAESLRSTGLFSPEYVQRLLREHRSGRADHRKPLWTLLVFELWRRSHTAAGARSAPLESIA
jgi:asparagine synthase (glutamine-hydrolysing)